MAFFTPSFLFEKLRHWENVRSRCPLGSQIPREGKVSPGRGTDECQSQGGNPGPRNPDSKAGAHPAPLGHHHSPAAPRAPSEPLWVGRITWAHLIQGIAPSPAPHLSPPLGCSHPNGGLSNRQAWGPLVGLHQQLSHCRGNQPEAGFPPWRCQWTDSCEGRPWPPNWLQSSSWRPQAGFKSCLYGLGQIFWLSQALVNSSIKDQY